MSRSVKALLLLPLFTLAACNEPLAPLQQYGYGSPISESELAAWDIDVGPDGVGLPAGSGTAETGEPVYLQKCAACHGEFGEGMGRFPVLTASHDELLSDRPKKAVGSYWPYATTLYDYIYRAMPFGNAQSLSPDEVYGITAYILAMNDIIASDEVLDANSLPKVQMPNREGFITATGPDIEGSTCMHDCMTDVKIESRAGLPQ